MSFILDALRKSERQRARSVSGRLGTLPPEALVHRHRTPWAVIVAVLVLANLVLGGVLLWQRHSAAPVAAPVETHNAPAGRVRSLADEARVPEPDDKTKADTGTAAEQPAVASSSAGSASVSSASESPSTEAAGAASGADSADQPRPETFSVVPLQAMPASFRQSLPALHLDVHGYAEDPSARFVVINLHTYHVGDTLREGPVVKAITDKGAVLSFHGQTFLLPRR
ncbi:MAG: general secretion pathway protein GspB [Gammaproteobacteria bacterium]|jgi:hypothetical protein